MSILYKEYEDARKAFLSFSDKIKSQSFQLPQSTKTKLSSHEILDNLYMDVLEIIPQNPKKNDLFNLWTPWHRRLCG